MITGGKSFESLGGLNSTELYIPSSKSSCRLPDLQYGRESHTQNNLLLCGGSFIGEDFQVEESVATGCLKWNSVNSSWEEVVSFDGQRMTHVSWSPAPDIGIFLMGGLGEDGSYLNTTTLVKPDGSNEPGFLLKYFAK